MLPGPADDVDAQAFAKAHSQPFKDLDFMLTSSRDDSSAGRHLTA